MFAALPTNFTLFLASILWPPDKSLSLQAAPELRFELRHQHAVSNGSRVVFADIPNSIHRDDQLSSLSEPSSYVVKTRPIDIHRPYSRYAWAGARRRELHGECQSATSLWEDVRVSGPDVESRETLLQLAKMANNAYEEPGSTGWYDIDDYWEENYPFGWEPDADGFRGHIFASTDNRSVVISMKGTSAGWLVGGGGPTVKKDKMNDNLLFSCCCARVGPTWSTVCGCYSGSGKCDQDCLEQSLVEESLFYNVAVNLYNNITYLYPDSEIWLIGHSLGGGLASLTGVTFGVPVVAFQSPGEKLAASRLHLPSPPSTQHITHVIQNADPIAMGTCTGVGSLCHTGGYALETHCHLGKTILYDTVQELGWSVDSRTHGIRYVIDNLLSHEWNATEPGEDEPGDEPDQGDPDGGEDGEKDGEKESGADGLGGGASSQWWPWGGKDKDKDEEKEGDDKKGDGEKKREVPEARIEEDCIDCHQWEYGDFKEKK